MNKNINLIRSLMMSGIVTLSMMASPLQAESTGNSDQQSSQGSLEKLGAWIRQSDTERFQNLLGTLFEEMRELLRNNDQDEKITDEQEELDTRGLVSRGEGGSSGPVAGGGGKKKKKEEEKYRPSSGNEETTSISPTQRNALGQSRNNESEAESSQRKNTAQSDFAKPFEIENQSPNKPRRAQEQPSTPAAPDIVSKGPRFTPSAPQPNSSEEDLLHQLIDFLRRSTPATTPPAAGNVPVPGPVQARPIQQNPNPQNVVVPNPVVQPRTTAARQPVPQPQDLLRAVLDQLHLTVPVIPPVVSPILRDALLQWMGRRRNPNPQNVVVPNPVAQPNPQGQVQNAQIDPQAAELAARQARLE